MSGLPALRCFILFAADLIILVLPSFGREAPEQMGQGFTLIYRFKFTWMDEFVLKPREFCGIESFHQPVDHVPTLENSSRSAADLKLPQRTTYRKTPAGSQSA